MNIKLLWDRVLVEPQAAETKTKSGLVLSKESEPGDVRIGIIKAVGCGKKLENGELSPVQVKDGDKVMFQYGANVLVDGKTYSLVDEGDIIMVF